ncbi:MAG: hypothetical protein U0230_16815 [Polyangiales bacterium]
MSRLTDDLDRIGDDTEPTPISLDAAVAGREQAAVEAAAAVLAAGGDVAQAARAALGAASAQDLALRGILFAVSDASATSWSTSRNTQAVDVVHAMAGYLGTVEDAAARSTVPTGHRFVVPSEPLWAGYRGHVVYLPADDQGAVALAMAFRILEEILEPEPEEADAAHAIIESLRHAEAAFSEETSAERVLSEAAIEAAIARVGDRATMGAAPAVRDGRSLALVDVHGNALVIAFGDELERLPVPAILDRGGRPWVVLAAEVDCSAPVLGLVHALVDRAVEPGVAIASTRFALGVGAAVAVEADVEPHVREGLVRRGHVVETVTRAAGSLVAVVIDEAFGRHALGDPRVASFVRVVQRASTSDQA